MATASAIGDDSDACVLCTSKHNRSRPSFCLCKHCSIPLCLECMNQHHNDILQNVAELSHQYNELQELLQSKQKMIVDESTKTVDDVNGYFDSYVKELRTVQRQIINDLQTTKEKAQGHLNEVNSNVQTVGGEIRALAKEKVAQTAKMTNLSTKMKEVHQRLNSYQAKRNDNLIRTKPTLSMTFDYSSDGTNQEQRNQTASKEPVTTANLSTASSRSSTRDHVAGEPLIDHFNHWWAAHDLSDLDNSVTNFGVDHVKTFYDVDRMASDGENILYASHRENQSDLITYCVVRDEGEEVYSSRPWNQSRIVDMIWWESIDKFVCATEDAVYTVEYIHGGLKITRVLRGSYPKIRIAANSTELYVHHADDGELSDRMAVYTTDFDLTNVYDVSGQQHLSTSSSFCVTDHLLAMICTRMQHNRLVFQVNFFDLAWNKLKWFRLGACDSSIEIRSDGEDEFFITTGRRQLYVVTFDGIQKSIELEADGTRIAVFDDSRLAISNGESKMQLVYY